MCGPRRFAGPSGNLRTVPEPEPRTQGQPPVCSALLEGEKRSRFFSSSRRSSTGTTNTELNRNTQPGRPGTQRLSRRQQESFLKSKCGQENDITTPRYFRLRKNQSPGWPSVYVGLSKWDEGNLPSLQVRSARSRIAVSLNSNGYEVVLIRHRQGPLSSFEKTVPLSNGTWKSVS